jgi:membrane-associated HD superfamily phosphohydrolase
MVSQAEQNGNDQKTMKTWYIVMAIIFLIISIITALVMVYDDSYVETFKNQTMITYCWLAFFNIIPLMLKIKGSISSALIVNAIGYVPYTLVFLGSLPPELFNIFKF